MAWREHCPYGAFYDHYPAQVGDIRRLEKMISQQQQQIDALTAKLTDIEGSVSGIASDVTNISAGITALEANNADLKKQIADLQAANPSLDLSGLTAAVDGLSGNLATVKASADSAAAQLPAPAPPSQATV